jgi:methylated-DNA-protein-cysteine methyltransferase-like protein
MPFSEFTQKVITVVQSVPQGNVVSYGQVAAYIGVPRAARQVGWTLRNLEADVSLPWWRVINNAGRITIKGNFHNTPDIQRKLLQADGVVVTEDFTINIEVYRFKASNELLKTWKLSDTYREQVLTKYGL